MTIKLSPWFKNDGTENPVRAGVYQVTNREVCIMHHSGGKTHYGWVLQWWNGEKWEEFRDYGFYGADGGEWRGITK
jgi:hypothetical protein